MLKPYYKYIITDWTFQLLSCLGCYSFPIKSKKTQLHKHITWITTTHTVTHTCMHIPLNSSTFGMPVSTAQLVQYCNLHHDEKLWAFRFHMINMPMFYVLYFSTDENGLLLNSHLTTGHVATISQYIAVLVHCLSMHQSIVLHTHTHHSLKGTPSLLGWY